jgi:hypothetical protein
MSRAWPKLTYFENYESEMTAYKWCQKERRLIPYKNLEVSEFVDSRANRKLSKISYDKKKGQEFEATMVADFKNKLFHYRSSETKDCIRKTIPYDINLRTIIRNFMSPKTGWSTYLGEVERAWSDEKLHAVFSYHEFEFWTVENVVYFSADKRMEIKYIESLNQ